MCQIAKLCRKDRTTPGSMSRLELEETDTQQDIWLQMITTLKPGKQWQGQYFDK